MLALAGAEQPAEARHLAETRDALLVLSHMVVEQAAEHEHVARRFTNTEVVIVRVLVTRSTAPAAPALKLEVSCSIVSFTAVCLR